MGVPRFILFLILLVSVPRLVHGNAEVRALMELKASLDPQNEVLRSWTSDGDPCGDSFVGVACNEHRKVANISLQGKGLKGTLSPALAELKCLSGLYLHYNSLSGEIPKEIVNLSELSDLYLNVNNFSGEIPSRISAMAGLQVLELCCNKLTGKIPPQIGSLKKLSVLSLQYNRLTGEIPLSLGSLGMLKRLDLSFNRLEGVIPASLAALPQLGVFDVRNNSLSGIVPPGLKRLNGGFQTENNPSLCGVGFSKLRACSPYDDVNINQLESRGQNINETAQKDTPKSVNIQANCRHCSRSSKYSRIAVVSGVITVTITLMGAGLIILFRYRRGKQKIGSTAESCDASSDQPKDFSINGASPLVCLQHPNGWDPLGDSKNGTGFSQDHLNSFRFSLEDIESATQCFSDMNLLGRKNLWSVYKGSLRDGSRVAIKIISITSCKNEATEFVKGLDLLTSLAHKNLVKLRGFCCSTARGECFLLYDFASKGKLSKYLDVGCGSGRLLDWPTRVSILHGIAEGISYLHRDETTKPTIAHRNISVEKVLIDQQFNPLIADSGLHKLLADDFVFSALKVSAAMGYLAPEYVTTGRFTEKTDIFAFGVIILQILCGKKMLTTSIRAAAESRRCEGFVDENLKGDFSEAEAAELARIAINCTDELPNNRPDIDLVIQKLNGIAK